MGKEEHAAFVWKIERSRADTELTIGALQELKPRGPEHVHPKRLLAELADEFDRGD